MTKSHGSVSFDVAVPTADLGYPVVVGANTMERLGSETRRVAPGAGRAALVSDDNVMPLHGERARRILEDAGFEVFVHVVPAGERSKTPARLLALVGSMLDAGLGRGDVVVALGGGVVGDLAGFAAAVFMRGVPFVQCPTSLLAQIDASVGGKVGVDLPQGKNLMGAFHFPGVVLIDPTVLRSLPDEEVSCGLAEMLKHGLLFSREHTEALLAAADAVYDRRVEVIAPLIARSVELKAACVARDPRERSSAGDGRVLLNLGHTVGHAIEAAADFALRHGQAVGLGLRATARISDRMHICAGGLEDVVVQALQRLRLPTDLEPWLHGARGRAVERALVHDKKRDADTITYIALADVARPRITRIRPIDILGFLRA